MLPHEKVFLENMPSADQYYKSFMHRDVINFVTVTRCVDYRLSVANRLNAAGPYRTDFIITTSFDGNLKFWKKQEEGIEFVKHYHAHLTPIVCVSASTDGSVFASIGEDGSCKIFDVNNFGTLKFFQERPHMSHLS